MPSAAPARSFRRRLESFLIEYGIVVATIGLATFLSFKSPFFLTTTNLLNIGNFAASTGIIVVAFTIAMISGQFDLSVGAAFALASVGFARVVETYHQPVIVGVVAAFGVAWALATLNSFLVVLLRLSPIVATFGTGLAGGAVAQLWQGQNIIFLTNRSDGVMHVMRAKLLGLPAPMLFMLFVFVLGWGLMTYARIGWHIYAVGASPSASLRAGLSPNRIMFVVFAITSSAAAFGALIDTGRLGFSSGTATFNGTFLAATLMGGVGLVGGTGKVQRAIFGVALISVMNNGLTLLNVDEYSIFLYQAALLVVAVAFAGLALKSSNR